jgi:hypothetical protein
MLISGNIHAIMPLVSLQMGLERVDAAINSDLPELRACYFRELYTISNLMRSKNKE